MNIFKTQYRTAKSLVEKINEQFNFYKSFSKYNDENSKQIADDCLKSACNNCHYLAAILGKECTVYSDKLWSNDSLYVYSVNEEFLAYQSELLLHGLIEIGDTLTDEQKMAILHEQEMQQQMEAYYSEF